MQCMEDFKELIANHNGILYKIGKVYSDEDDFDDLYQEMLINIWNGKKNFKGDSKLSTWIYRVCLNTALSYHKVKKRKQLPQQEITNLENVLVYEEDVSKDLEIQNLYKAIKELKVSDRSIVLLYLEDKSYEEIAEITGLTPNNVGVKINRIKKSLLKILNKNGHGRR